MLTDINSSFGIADRNYLHPSTDYNLPAHPNSVTALSCKTNTSVIVDIAGTLFDFD